MEKISTVKQILEKHYSLCTDEDGTKIMYFWEIEKAMIEFAKMYVKAALEKVTNNIEIHSLDNSDLKMNMEYFNNRNNDLFIDKDSILNAYPERNIK